MALVIPDTFLCRINWSQPVNMRHAPQNVFGIQVDPAHGALTQAIVDSIGDEFDASWTFSAIGARVTSSCDPTTLTVTDIRTATGPEFSTALAAAATGTADPLPGETALCASLRTAKRGRSFRGRFYLPGCLESENDSTGRPSTTITGALFNLLNDFNGRISVLPNMAGLCVISRLLLESNLVTSVIVNTSWDSQRRRGFV